MKFPVSPVVSRKHGFSLVLSLTVMAMLLLLCVGATALLSIHLRVAQASAGVAKARLNALVGARIALGELQRLAGPDQRITATADLLTKNDFTVSSDGIMSPGPLDAAYYKGASGEVVRHPRWMGIWNSGQMADKRYDLQNPLPASGESGKVVQRDTEGRLKDSRFQTGQNWTIDRASSNPPTQTRRFLGWLVSGNEARPSWDAAGGPTGQVTPYSSIDMTQDAVLLGSGALGKNFKPTDTTSDMLGARARLVSIQDGTDTPRGQYAFWVSDEGVKAKLNIVDRMPQGTPSVSDPHGAYRRLLTTQRNRFTLAKGTDGTAQLAGLDALPPSTLGTIHSMQEISLASGATTGASDYSSNYFHDISFVSKGLLTDNVNGGLKRDLTAYLSGQNTAPKGDYLGVVDNDPILTGPNFTPFTPKYSYLKNWITQAPPVAAAGASNIYPQPSTAIQWGLMPYRSPDYTNQPTPIRMPVLTQMQYYLSGATWNSPQGPKAGYAIAPLVTIWNPYPVALTVSGLSAHVIYSGNFNGGIRYKNAAGANTALGLGFGGYGAGPMTKFNLPNMVLAPGESVTLGAPSNVTEMTVTNYSAFNNPITQPGTLAPLSSSTGFYFVNKATAQQATDIMNDPNACWNEMSGWQGFANLNGSTQQMMLIDNASKVAIRQVMAEGWSHWNGYAKTYFQWLFSGVGENGRARVLSLPNDKAYSLTYPGSESFSVGWRMMCVDEPQAKAAPGYVKNRNNNFLVQWNFNAPKFTRNPFDGNSQQRSSNTANGGLFVFETDPNRYSAAHTSPLLFNSNLAPARISPIDVPRKEWGVWSLAQLQHCPMSQLSWQPALAVGNSFPCETVGSGSSARGDGSEKYCWGNSANAIYGGIATTNMPEFETDYLAAKSKTKNGAYPHYLFDLCYEVNKDLFDSWHVSGAGMGGENKGVAWSKGEMWEPSEKNCPNSRYVSTDARHNCPSPLYAAAAGMMIDGAFNINSTSQAAWVALLSSAREISVPTAAGDVSTKGQTPFPHHARPLGKDVASKSTQAYDEAAWAGVRTLSDDEIQVLAAYMVQTVKERGPFLGLSDFVNRRLENRLGAKDHYARFVGAIQAAIDKTTRQNQLINNGLEAKDNTAIARINTDWVDPVQIPSPGLAAKPYKDPVSNTVVPGVWTDSICQSRSRSMTPHAENRVFNKTVGAPGYLTQADVLQHIGTALSARSDTFTVRALGSDIDSGASVVVEIVVQRTPNAFFPLNRQTNGDYIPDPTKPAFGRRFVVTQTRWLIKDEI